MRKLLLLLVLLLPLLVVAGCEQGPTEPAVRTTGTWSGTTQLAGVPVHIALVLAESGRDISGQANLTSAAGSGSANVSGRNNFPNVTLRLQQPGGIDVSYQGTFAGDNMIVGTLTGSGFGGAELNLQRQ